MFVLGCHRSGTSYISGILSSTISSDRSRDLDATVDNPRGYFESTLLRPLNDALMIQAGYSWDRPPLSPVYWREGRHLLTAFQYKSEFSSYALTTDWVDKDPRLSLTFPFFEHLLLKRVPCLAVLRHPIGVAKSLKLRDGFSFDKGLLIWFLYNRSCACFLREDVDQLVSYEEVLNGERSQLGRLNAFLLSWARRRDVVDRLDALIDQSHHAMTDQTLHRNISEQIAVDSDGFTSPHLYEYCLNLYREIEAGAFSLQAFANAFAAVPSWLVNDYGRIFAEGMPSLEFLHTNEVRFSSHIGRALSSSLETGDAQLDSKIIKDFSDLIETFHLLQQQIHSVAPACVDEDLSLGSRIAELDRELRAIQSSASWRLTAPLRLVLDRIKSILHS